MKDDELSSDVSRSEFLRRTGALGIAGASVLGFPLIEYRVADAKPLLPPKDVIAAGGGVTVKIGHIDGFSGVYAAASESQQTGLEAAIEAHNKKNSRVQFEIVRGDDTNAPAVGSNEAKRLISQAKVDVLTGCLSSAVGLAVSSIAQENGVFFLAVGTHDTNITGPKANRACFRQTCSNAMLANAVGPALLKKGKRWYFLVADYAFGTDAYARFKKILLANGGTEAGVDKHALTETDYSSYLTRARNTNADVLIFANYGPNTQNAAKQAVGLGLNKKMTFGGILCGNEVAVGMPVDYLVGSLWGYVWGPEAGGARTAAIYAELKKRAKGFPPNWRQYLGLMAGENLINRIQAAGTTDGEALVKAFEGHKYDAGKSAGAYFRKCDHQAIQQTYAGEIVAKNKRRSADEYFTIHSTVGGEYAAESCANPDSAAAEKIITSQKLVRADYTPVKTK
ncbi:MAG: ABC transporter substrate-binding protein [Candidatus Eremiobacteraeota bacterium]|nr:ABC transporter substrate-binding protein [Candidatus Eremiobacteraeota bacterium]